MVLPKGNRKKVEMPKQKFHKSLPSQEVIDNWDESQCKSFILKSEAKLAQLTKSEESARERLQIAQNLRMSVPPLQIAVKARLGVLTNTLQKFDATSMRAMLKAGQLEESVIMELAKALKSSK